MQTIKTHNEGLSIANPFFDTHTTYVMVQKQQPNKVDSKKKQQLYKIIKELV